MKNLKKCLVTGGAGFIGSHLVERLLKEGSQVTVIDDLSEGKWENLPKHKNLKKIKASILDDLSEFVKGQDAIFHLAAIPRLRKSLDDPWKTHIVNVDGTLNMLLLAKKYKVKRFIFASSSSVYGDQNRLPFTEDMKPNPLVPYALHKLIGEEYCKMFFDLWGLSVIFLRYFNVYGPKMNPNSPYALLIPKFIQLMSQNKKPTIHGSGTHSRDFTYVTDAVEATLLAAKSKFAGDIFNIGYGESFSVNKVVGMLNQLMGKKIKPVHGPEAIESKITLASNLKAGKFLGWKPKVKLEEGLRKML